jgi:hypothetical protein
MLAHQHDARITFLFIIADGYPQATLTIQSLMGAQRWTTMSESQAAETNAPIKERIQRFCEDVASEMASCPLAVNDIVINRAVPVEVILKEADAKACDLIPSVR